jgi:hypothetical protein
MMITRQKQQITTDSYSSLSVPRKREINLLFWQGVLFAFGLGSLLIECLIFFQTKLPTFEDYTIRSLMFVAMIMGFLMVSIWSSEEKRFSISKRRSALGVLLLSSLLLLYEFVRFSLMLKAKNWPLSPLFICINLVANIFFISISVWSSHKSKKSKA